MSSLAGSLGEKSWQWVAVGGGIFLVWVAIATPNLLRTRAPYTDGNRFPLAQRDEAAKSIFVGNSQADAAAERKIVRTSSISMVVQHPSELADKITALTEGLGGFLVSANAGGENASSGMLTIRVPAERFDEVRAAIRRLGLRIESERIDALDVSRQYVDQEASLRNLKAEEAQYLAILKQANTVKDMLTVTEKLSEVRGQIEQRQAEFNALSRQIETVATTISLRTEDEERVFGLNWRPLYQLKIALRDGLESLANYATAMLTIVSYLPAVLLWAGTILAGVIGSWRAALWIGARWFGWRIAEPSATTK